MEAGNPLLDDYVLRLTGARAPAGLLPADRLRRRRPLRRALLPRLRGRRLRAQPRLAVPPRPGAGASTGDLAAHLLAQDLIYVGGGSVLSLLGTWRAHGHRPVAARGVAARRRPLRAERRLAVLVRRGGHRVPRRAASACAGLGLLPHSNCVHYDGEPARRAEYHRFVGDGMRAGYAADDGAALHFVGTRARSASWRRARASAAYRVAPRRRHVVETPLATTSTSASAASPVAGRVTPHDPRDGRRRLHRASPATPRSTSSSSSSPAGAGAADPASCRPRSGDPQRADRAASTPPSATAPCEPDVLSLFRLARRRRAAARDRARAGRRLRRRRLDAQPAGDLARARPRPRAARGVGARRRARRAERRRDVLVRGRGDHVRRRARADARARASCPGSLSRPRRRRARARCPVYLRGRRDGRAAGRLGWPTTASACSSATRELERVVSRAPGRRARRAWTRVGDATWSSRAASPT